MGAINWLKVARTICTIAGVVVIDTPKAHAWMSGQSFNITTVSGGSASTCTGQGSDSTVFANFLTAALAGQTGNPGLVTLTVPAQGTVSNITNAVASGTTLTLTTSAAHGWSTGQWVTLSGIGGLTFNGPGTLLTGSITVIDATHFSMVITTAPGTYTSGGISSSSVCMLTTVDNHLFAGLLQVRVIGGDGNSIATGVTFSTGGMGQFYFGGLTSTINRGPWGSLASGTYISGLTPSGTGTCTLGSFNGAEQTAFATLPVSGGSFTTTTLTIAQAGGFPVTQAPTTATGSGACSGTATVTTVLNNFYYSARAATVTAGATQITLLVPNLASLFTPGQYALLAGLDMQSNGYPQNQAQFEWVCIQSVNAGTGVVTFQQSPTSTAAYSLLYTYESTWPNYQPGNDFAHDDQGGPATLFVVDPTWNIQVEVDGVVVDQVLQQTYSVGYSTTYKNGGFTGGNCGIPTQAQYWAVTNENMSGCDLEFDKLVTNITMDSTTVNHVIVQSASFYNYTIQNGSVIQQLGGTGISTVCNNSTIVALTVGVEFYGLAKSFSANNCIFNSLATTSANWVGALNNGGYGSISNGVITSPNINGATVIAFPRANIFWLGGAGSGVMGFPFMVSDLTISGSNTLAATSLSGGVPPVPGSHIYMVASPNQRFTCVSCSGSASALDLNGAPAGAPLYTYSSRTTTFAVSGAYAGGTVWGQVVSIDINVVTPYNGAGSLTLSPMSEFANGFPLLDLTTSTQGGYGPLINTKIAGLRHITPNGVTGTQSGDSNLALPSNSTTVYGTMAPFLNGTCTAGGGTVCPVVTITFNTTQAQQFQGSLLGGNASVSGGVVK